MNATEITAITEGRLEAWAQRVAEKHCTPAILVSVGHDHQQGNLHISVPHDLPLPLARGYLIQALKELDETIAQNNGPDPGRQ